MVFRDPVPAELTRLLHLSHKEWQPLLSWLDTSGLALYFLDRMKALNRLDTMPEPILDRLRKNLADNSRRIDGMIAESVALQRRFQDAGLSYAVLKGFSLWPISVPKLELRSQIDLDFLVAEEHASEARRILESTGYELTAMAGESGRSWEFETGENYAPSLDNLYKSGMRRRLATFANRTGLLSRRKYAGAIAGRPFSWTRASRLSARMLRACAQCASP